MTESQSSSAINWHLFLFCFLKVFQKVFIFVFSWASSGDECTGSGLLLKFNNRALETSQDRNHVRTRNNWWTPKEKSIFKAWFLVVETEAILPHASWSAKTVTPKDDPSTCHQRIWSELWHLLKTCCPLCLKQKETLASQPIAEAEREKKKKQKSTKEVPVSFRVKYTHRWIPIAIQIKEFFVLMH